jgi:hypothetical protein
VPADGHYGCQLEETKTSVTSPFFVQLFGQVSACLYMTIMGMPEIKNNRSRAVLCRGGRLIDRDCVSSAAALSYFDNFFSLHVWFIYIACSRPAPPRRLNQSVLEIVIISSGSLYRHCWYEISLLERGGRQRAPRLPDRLMNAVHNRPRASTVRWLALQRMHATISGVCPSCVARSILAATTKE